jgi:NADPH2:quinone reductase
MKAILCSRFADEPALALGEMPDPQPQADGVLVEVHAAAVSFMDLLMAQGRYQMRPELPYVPGTDAAGVVLAVGDKVTRFRAGDRVACANWHGAWARRMVAPEHNVTLVPEHVEFATAASLRYAYGTARYALVTTAHLRPGETLFVSGAAGGVGLAGVDLGRQLGARVIAGVGTRGKEAVVRDRGASEVVVYGEEDLRERIKALTGGQGVDVCLDNVGGAVFTAMTRLMNWGGRLLPIGFTSGEIPSVAANLLLLKNYSVMGAFWGAWNQRFPREAAADADALMRLVAAGELRPLVSHVPWEQFAGALDTIRRRDAQGRLVLSVAGAGLDPPTVRQAWGCSPRQSS